MFGAQHIAPQRYTRVGKRRGIFASILCRLRGWRDGFGDIEYARTVIEARSLRE